ncbi:MAG: hypothetical protein ABI576_07695 [Flavobacterium sp.]
MKAKKTIKKFELEKMNVTKLKNLHLIVGGGNIEGDDPIDTNKLALGSSKDCR